MTVSLPEDRGLKGDGRPRARRFRSADLQLGRRLKESRQKRGLTQAKVGALLGGLCPSTICQWERGRAVPSGVYRQRLMELLSTE